MESQAVEAAEDRTPSSSSGFRSSCAPPRGPCSSRAATTCASTGRRTSTGARSRSASRSTCRATSPGRRCRSPLRSGRRSRAGCGSCAAPSTRRSSARARASRPTARSPAQPSGRASARTPRSPPPTPRSGSSAWARSAGRRRPGHSRRAVARHRRRTVALGHGRRRAVALRPTSRAAAVEAGLLGDPAGQHPGRRSVRADDVDRAEHELDTAIGEQAEVRHLLGDDNARAEQ